MSDLIRRLCQGDHPVEVALRNKSIDEFKQCLDRGYVHIKFTETRGGTELGIRLDHKMTNLSGADFQHETGLTKLVGNLTLDYTPVRCIAEIRLPELSGVGRLEIRASD